MGERTPITNSNSVSETLANGGIKQRLKVRGGSVTRAKLVEAQLLWKADDLHGPVDAEFIPWDASLAVTDFQSGLIHLYSTMSGVRKGLIGGGASSIRAKGIVATKTGAATQLVVVDSNINSLSFVTLPEGSVKSWKSDLFSQPFGLALTIKGNFVITDQDPVKPSVYIHDATTGVRIREFGHGTPSDSTGYYDNSSETGNLNAPTYVTVDQHNRIIVTDTADDSVKAYDEYGRCLLKFDGTGSGSDAMKPERSRGSVSSDSGAESSAIARGRKLCRPGGVFVDNNDYVFVSDTGHDAVALYSAGGKFIQNILSAEEEILSPTALTISGGGLMAVTSNVPKSAASRVSVYQV